MSEMTLQELEAAARTYERSLVPAIFGNWTSRVAGAAGIRPGQRVLDVACGTGILARAASREVQPGGSVVGLDINPGMLSVARELAPAIEWREGQAESLPFADQSFDAVVSQFGLMFFADRGAALREMMRVLVPGGRMAVAVFDSLDDIPGYATMVAVLEKVVGNGAAEALRSPFVLGDTEELLAQFREAGIEAASISSHTVSESFPSVKAMVLGDVEGWFPLAGIRLDDTTLQALIEAAETAMRPYALASGAVEFEVGAHIVAASKPIQPERKQ